MLVVWDASERGVFAQRYGAGMPTPTVTPPVPTCAGDCNGDNRVAINELIIGVNIALESQPIDSCPSFDTNDNGRVAINELIVGVNNALGGCG